MYVKSKFGHFPLWHAILCPNENDAVLVIRAIMAFASIATKEEKSIDMITQAGGDYGRYNI